MLLVIAEVDLVGAGMEVVVGIQAEEAGGVGCMS